MRLLYVNFLWYLFTVIGLGIFGFMPATIAMFAVVRKWLMDEDDIPIFKTFWDTYRTNFFKVSLFGAVVLLIGFILLVEMNIFWSQGGTLYFVISLAVIATFLIYAIVLIYFFPLFVHYESTIFQYVKMSLVMGIIHPFVTTGLLLLVVIFYITFLILPLPFILFGGSISALIIMRLVSNKFPSIEA